jgi:hypothetical protein
MRIFKSTAEFNWRYALGEVLLIVIGVSIALAANSWYESRQLRVDEIAFLKELQVTLHEDLNTITTHYNTIKRVNENIELFVSNLDAHDPDQDELTRGIRAATRFVTLNLRYGPYESLKARGISLISNESLGVTITSLYEDEIPNLVEDSVIDRRLIRDNMLPSILDRFSLDASQTWSPKETRLASWRIDLATLGRYRAMTLSGFYLPSFERTIQLTSDALADIEAELKQRQSNK